jgi:type 1 glutamine amidotransferase
VTELALVVRGGLALHQPTETTDSFLKFLQGNDFDVEVAESLDVYLDDRLLRRTRVIVNCWTDGDLTADQAAGLDRAVRAGTGYAGWHGGIVAAFSRREYHWITGGMFIGHPGDFVPHTLTVTRPDHPITTGIATVDLDTERYWLLTDPLNEVLATITFAGEPPWHETVTHPAVWTRRWGEGRVFVSTVGHHLTDLEVPDIRRLTERGILWAAGLVSAG